MNLPAAWTERLPFLDPLEEKWQPVHRAVLIGAGLFYLLFLVDLAQGGDFPKYMDLVFIPIHEGGHLLFRFFGMFIAVAGGTFLQLAVPVMLAAWFFWHRQVPGVTFCVFFFFEQFLPTATYMADARAQELPLLTVGDSDNVIHDWNYMFGQMGLLDHDTQIAHAVRIIGWMGMFATVGWFVWRGLQSQPVEKKPQPFF